MEGNEHDLVRRRVLSASSPSELNDNSNVNSAMVYPKNLQLPHSNDLPPEEFGYDFFSPLNEITGSIGSSSRSQPLWLNPIPINSSSSSSGADLGLVTERLSQISLSNNIPDSSTIDPNPHDHLRPTTTTTATGRGSMINSQFIMSSNKREFSWDNNDHLIGLINNNNNNNNNNNIGGQQFFWAPQHEMEIRGQVLGILKNEIERGKSSSPELIERILWEVKDYLHELMMDRNYIHFIVTVFEASTTFQKTKILDLLFHNYNKLTQVCIDDHGTRVVQRLLKCLKTPYQKSTAILAIKQITPILAKSNNGGYIIHQCLKLFAPEFTKHILDEIAKNCVEIATDRSGCSFFQKTLDQAKGDDLKRLLEEVVSNVLLLTQDPYGNYVVQYVVKMKIAQVNKAIIAQLVGKYGELSLSKHASNVVENLLEFSQESDAAVIVQQIMYHPNLLGILHNPYGNYVAQSALKNSKGILHEMFSCIIMSYYPYLLTHPYGKRVLPFVNRPY